MTGVDQALWFALGAVCGGLVGVALGIILGKLAAETEFYYPRDGSNTAMWGGKEAKKP